MNQKFLNLITTIGVLFIGLILIILLWNYLSWYSLIIVLPIIIFLEIYILNKIDSYFIILKKKKLVQMGILSEPPNLQITSDTSPFDKFKHQINLYIKNINDILIDMDDIYYESLQLLDDGDILHATRKFNSILSHSTKNIESIDLNVISLTNQTLQSSDPSLKLSIKNYKELWDKTRIDILNKIKTISEKFKIRSDIHNHIEKIFKFEIEHDRKVDVSDINSLDIPLDQFNRVIRIIEKPIKINLNKLSPDDKQRLGNVSKKIISTCMKYNISPNLPYLFYVLKIDLKTAKEILSYLKNIGMLDVIFYHVPSS